MNRLWVRFALVISGIILAVLIVPVVLGPVVIALFDVPTSDPDLDAIVAALPPDLQARLHERIQSDSVRGIVPFMAVVALIGALAGGLLSRMLLSPLQGLTDGAEAIANQNLAYRVPVNGTTEMRMVAESFNDMAGNLEQAELLRRQMLADVSHELRNPLHVLRGNLQAMVDGVYPMDEQEVGRLLDQTDHLTSLVNDLHELALAEARQLPLATEKLDLGLLVKDVGTAFRPLAASEDIGLRIELLGPPPQVRVDPSRFQQILQNLLWNAIRHTPAGGQIMLSVERQGDKAVVTVSDNGSGMSAEHLPHVFDRFYRVESARDRETGGAGLGLAIVKAIVEAHGGSVIVASAGVDQGSTFTVIVPAVV